MTDKSTLLKTFNAQFFAFLDDIISIYPENRELQKGKKSFELIKMANASMIIKVWYSHIYSLYANEIENGDVDFFITKDYSNDFNLSINVLNNLYSNVGKIEYLVKKDVLIDYANNFAGLELIESDTFYNTYLTWKNIITNIHSNNNYNTKIKNIYENLFKFYNSDNKLDKDSLEFTKLNRFYIFKKV